jgi:hypothetical protein
MYTGLKEKYLLFLNLTTIYYLSNHSTGQKIAAYRYHINRMQSLPLTIERQQTEWNTIKTMAQNNSFPEHFITNLKVQIKQQKVHQTQDKDENKKRATFTYYSPKIRKLTNLFKHTNINIAFKNTNTIQQYTKPKTIDKNQDYNASEIYKLTCNTCKISYIGHTSRNVNQRSRKHIRYIRNNDPQSAYAQHILQNLHKYGSITDNMSLLKPIYKTSMLIPYEQLFTQTFHHNWNLIKEQGTGEQNPLFQLTIDTMLTSAITWKHKQFNTPPTTHPNQFQLFHNSSR